MKSFFSLVFAVLLITCCYGQKEKLELNLVKGETYTLKSTTNFSFDVPLNGKQVRTVSLTYCDVKFKVADIHDSIFEMDAKIDSIRYNGNLFSFSLNMAANLKGPISNDSKNLALERILKSLKGMPYHFKMSRTGVVSELKNMNADTSRFQLTCNLLFRQMAHTIPAIYPTTKVSPGDKWNISITIQPSAAFNVKNIIYELTEVTDSTLLISGSSTLKIDDKDAKNLKVPENIKQDITTTFLSNIILDRKTGWIIDAKSKQIIKGTITEKAVPKKSGNKVHQLNLKSEITLAGNKSYYYREIL